MVYWDSSVILKLYVSERDSEEWQTRALRGNRPLRSSSLLLAEIAFALRHKETRGEINAGAARKLYLLFREDVAAGKIQVFPMGADVLEESAVLADMRKAGKAPLLRTLDGLHLATAKLLKCREIATTDARMRTMAKALGFGLYE